jgi:hypothetical protein
MAGIFCWSIWGSVDSGDIGMVVYGSAVGMWGVCTTGGRGVWRLCCWVVWYGCVDVGDVYVLL